MNKILSFAENPDNAYQLGNTKFRIRKFLLKRTNKNGLANIYIEVVKYNYNGTGSYDETFKRINTGIKIKPANWNKMKDEVKNIEPDADFKNNQINKKYNEVLNFINNKGQQYENQVYVEKLDIEELREFFPNRSENRKSLYDFICDYHTFRKNQKTKPNTLKEFKTLENRILAFDEYLNKKTYFEDINFTWSDQFEDYLLNECEYGDGTIQKTYTILITTLNHYYQRRKELNIELSNDFQQKGFKRGSKSINEPNPLTPEQLTILHNHKFNEPHLERTKTRFLLQCYTGLRFSDFHKIKPKNVKNNVLVLKLEKTERFNSKIEQPLNKYSKEILAELNYDTSSLKISNQPYNIQLHEIWNILRKEYKKAEFKDYTSHNARDTFVSICLMKGVQTEIIMKWTAHKTYSAFSRYYKILEEHQVESMQKVF